MVRSLHGQTSFPHELPRRVSPSSGSTRLDSGSVSIRPQHSLGALLPVAFAARPNHIRYRGRAQHHQRALAECGTRVSVVELSLESQTLCRTWRTSNKIRGRGISEKIRCLDRSEMKSQLLTRPDWQPSL